MEQQTLKYKHNAPLRGKNRKVRIEQVYDMDNLVNADKKARRRKTGNRGVVKFDCNRELYFNRLHKAIKEHKYRTSPGHEVKQLCPCGKVRILHKLPYYPDHIVHHALMQTIMPILNRYYYYDSSASVEGKGIHFAEKRTAKWIDKNKSAGRIYYAKMDFVKFYHKIDQKKCFESLMCVFGNKGIRYLLHEVVTACESGLGIGLYPIQPIANFYMCSMCRDLMRRFDVFVEIYCDDIVIMSKDKKQVWKAVRYVQEYAEKVLCQPLHENVGVQIIDETHFLDFVGYRFYINHTLLRKRMKIKFKKKMYRLHDPLRRYRVAVSYKGWLEHCNGLSLWRSVMKMKSFNELKIPKFERRDSNGNRILEGTKIAIAMLLDQPLEFLDVEMSVKSKFNKPTAIVQVQTEQGKKFKFFTSGPRLLQIFQYVIDKRDALPFKGRIVNNNNAGYPDYDIID